MNYDILLLNLHRKHHHAEVNHGDFAGLHLIAAFLGQNGFEARVFGGDLHAGWRLLEETYAVQAKGMIGLYCDFENVTEIKAISCRIKAKYNIPVIVGGPQATALNEVFLVESFCDVIVRGEGELTMLELAHHFLDKAGKLEDINGIAFINQGKYVVRPPQPLIENLDALPFINAKYSLNHDFRQEHSSIMTGRGCPFQCAFCHEGHHTKKVRFRSVDNVLKEIRQIFQDHSEQKYFLFTDDTFTLQPLRVKEICAGVKELREEYPFIWFCEGHVKTLCQHPEMIDDMVEAGLHRIQLGIEAGTREVLNSYRKGSTPEEIKQLVILCRDKGVQQLYGNIIIGGAMFSREVWERDRVFVRELLEAGRGTVEIGVVFFWPLPETSMTKDPAAYGIRLHDVDFLTSVGDFPLVDTEQLTLWEINEMGRLLQQEIVKHMQFMLTQQMIPHERILSWFQIGQAHYGGAGMWYQLAERMEFLGSYYTLLASSTVRRSKDIDSDFLATWHPQRLIVMQHHVRTESSGDSYIEDIKLSSLDRELLRYSTGKLKLQSVLDRIYPDFITKFTDYEEYCQAALQSLEKMEQRYWLVYSEI